MSTEKSGFDEKKIGDRIREVRATAKLSQKAFAARIGIQQGFLSELEQGKYQPNQPLLLAIAYRFQISEEWLMAGVGPMRQAPAPMVAEPREVYLRKLDHIDKREREYTEKLVSIFRTKDEGTISAITQNIDTFLRVPDAPQKKGHMR